MNDEHKNQETPAQTAAGIRHQAIWEKKELWHHRGRNFCIEISHHTVIAKQCWCIYAYIYPEHSYYKEFRTDSMTQDAAIKMPFHCGATFFQRHPRCIQVGCDYNHLGYEYFAGAETPEEARAIWKDAEILFNWLEKSTFLKGKQMTEFLTREENATDIATRLRRWWQGGAQIWQRDAKGGAMLLEAADEIDRLREGADMTQEQIARMGQSAPSQKGKL